MTDSTRSGEETGRAAPYEGTQPSGTTDSRSSSPDNSAAQDQDVAVVRERLGYIEDKIVRAAVDGALARIEQRLIAGAAMAAVVDECVKAGHITAVPS